ncbi:FG-GAP-like repeat-containing protein [Desulfocurvus sp. DL9XJH121]
MAVLRFLAAALAALVLAAPALAQDVEKTFTVTPFTINGPDKYAYLSRGVQDMLISRLAWENHFKHIGKDKLGKAQAPGSDTQAADLRSSLGSDYLVWGSITIMGDQCSVDVRTTGPQSTQPESDQTTISGLIPSLEKISKNINAKIFKRPEPAAQAEEKPELVKQLNPELIHNETGPAQEFYLNPQFRYAGGTDTPGRWRSPTLPFTSNGMIVGDADNDGKNEMLFISENTVYVYRVEGEKFLRLDNMNPGGRTELLNINLLDINRDGYPEIVISGFFENEASSYIMSFRDGHLKVEEKRIPFFLNVVSLPPLYQPVLVGQQTGDNNVLDSNVFEMVKAQGKYAKGRRVPLPDTANCFNFTFLPTQGMDYKLMVINNEDRIEVYTPTFDLQSTTFDQYGGSALGFEIPDTFKGFSTSSDQYMNYYYIPLRMVVADVDGNGTNEVLTNKNISTAAQFFKSYRFFPNGEIHALFWDGVGLSLAWKTRRIKGSVADYGLADINNDGQMDMFVCLNTHPGTLGIHARKTTVIAYAIDTEMQKSQKTATESE